jgi:hypothetical protein
LRGAKRRGNPEAKKKDWIVSSQGLLATTTDNGSEPEIIRAKIQVSNADSVDALFTTFVGAAFTTPADRAPSLQMRLACVAATSRLTPRQL